MILDSGLLFVGHLVDLILPYVNTGHAFCEWVSEVACSNIQYNGGGRYSGGGYAPVHV